MLGREVLSSLALAMILAILGWGEGLQLGESGGFSISGMVKPYVRKITLPYICWQA